MKAELYIWAISISHSLILRKLLGDDSNWVYTGVLFSFIRKIKLYRVVQKKLTHLFCYLHLYLWSSNYETVIK